MHHLRNWCYMHFRHDWKKHSREDRVSHVYSEYLSILSCMPRGKTTPKFSTRYPITGVNLGFSQTERLKSLILGNYINHVQSPVDILNIWWSLNSDFLRVSNLGIYPYTITLKLHCNVYVVSVSCVFTFRSSIPTEAWISCDWPRSRVYDHDQQWAHQNSQHDPLAVVWTRDWVSHLLRWLLYGPHFN